MVTISVMTLSLQLPGFPSHRTARELRQSAWRGQRLRIEAGNCVAVLMMQYSAAKGFRMTIAADRPANIDFAAARRAMIDSQLRVSGINADWVIGAMNGVAREDHVPAAARSHAYIDRAIPLEGGHALPAPLFHARLLAEAVPTGDDRVLLVSCGSSYLPALVEPLAGAVVTVSAADAVAGKTGKGGYSLLLIDGAVEHVPDVLVKALAEGARVVAGLVQRGVTRLAAGRKVGGALALAPLADMGIPVLGEFAAPQRWSF
jgi:protein-L-isoaspartate(D-aspartate) O-methyltransferase